MMFISQEIGCVSLTKLMRAARWISVCRSIRVAVAQLLSRVQLCNLMKLNFGYQKHRLKAQIEF